MAGGGGGVSIKTEGTAEKEVEERGGGLFNFLGMNCWQSIHSIRSG